MVGMKLCLKEENICKSFEPLDQWIRMNFKGDVCVKYQLV